MNGGLLGVKIVCLRQVVTERQASEEKTAVFFGPPYTTKIIKMTVKEVHKIQFNSKTKQNFFPGYFLVFLLWF